MAATGSREEPDATPQGAGSGFSVAALSAGVALAVVGVVAWEAVLPGIWHDDGAYVLLDQSLAEGEGLRYSQVAGSPPGAKLPPLYPLVLAGLLKIAPSMVTQGSLAAFMNLVFVVVGGGVFVSYLRSLDFSWRSSVATATFLWLMPDIWRLSLVPLSEPLFLLMLVLALWAGLLLEREPTGPSLAIVLVAFAAAYHVRTMGVALGGPCPWRSFFAARWAGPYGPASAQSWSRLPGSSGRLVPPGPSPLLSVTYSVLMEVGCPDRWGQRAETLRPAWRQAPCPWHPASRGSSSPVPVAPGA